MQRGDGIDHLGTDCADLEPVAASHDVAVAVAHGAEVLHQPRHFPERPDHHFGAFVRDLEANNVEAVCRTVAPG
ncbi:MAG: hypothetical protein WBP61_08685 [Nocardioides sp.]